MLIEEIVAKKILACQCQFPFRDPVNRLKPLSSTTVL